MEFTTHFGLQSQTTRLSEDGSGPRTPPPRTGLSPSPTCLSRPTWAVAPRVQSPRPATIRWRRSARDCLLELFPLRSPLLGESSLVALPPLIDMLKFGGSPRLIWGPRTRPNDETPNAHRHRRSRRNGTTTGSPLPPRPKRGPEMGRPDRHPRRSRRIAHLGRRRPPPGSTTTRTAPKSRCRPPATTPRYVSPPPPPPPPPTGGTKTDAYDHGTRRRSTAAFEKGTLRQTCRRPDRRRHLRSKTRWFTEFRNSHYVSQFAAFFIDARTEGSTVRSFLLVLPLPADTRTPRHPPNVRTANKKKTGLERGARRPRHPGGRREDLAFNGLLRAPRDAAAQHNPSPRSLGTPARRAARAAHGERERPSPITAEAPALGKPRRHDR